MERKYGVSELSGGWAVVMSACGRIMEMLPSEREAKAAVLLYESGQRIATSRPRVRIVGDFVCEAGEGGAQLGTVEAIDLSQYEVVEEVSQEEFDAEMEEFFQEHGHYPDQ